MLGDYLAVPKKRPQLNDEGRPRIYGARSDGGAREPSFGYFEIYALARRNVYLEMPRAISWNFNRPFSRIFTRQ